MKRTVIVYAAITGYLVTVVSAIVLAPLFFVTLSLIVVLLYTGLAYHHRGLDLRHAKREIRRLQRQLLPADEQTLLRRMRDGLDDPPPADLLERLYNLPPSLRRPATDQGPEAPRG
jgi:hypothetical protein